MKDKYYEQAVTCVKDRVLPVQMPIYKVIIGQTGWNLSITDSDPITLLNFTL